MLLALLFAAQTPPATIVAADGHWAALRRGATCEAASLSLRGTAGQRPPARASLAFDAPGGVRRGQFAVRLNRPARDGASVLATIGKQPFLLVGRGEWAWSNGAAQDAAIIAALRAGGWMSVQSRAANGGAIVDQYDLSGAPTAIDAAAACAAGLAKR
ncbi:hypothetical protein ABDK56_06415 [Sphingomonas sp. ASV193]|uniref:hypothetical protein n=1 Tax=Sphingomonas sp. ASV193 TaxID=3144405 RepID=UPI0032E89298